MLDIPYEKNRGLACALACYTMTARYYFPEATWEQIAKISNWEPGYVVWSFRFWKWIMDKGIKITDYDMIDFRSWADEGLEGLRKSVSEKEFEFYKTKTKDIESYSEDIKKVLEHENFIHKKEVPTFKALEEAFEDGCVCEVMLDSCALDQIDGFSLHRVVVLDIDDNNIVFHDPKDKQITTKKKGE